MRKRPFESILPGAKESGSFNSHLLGFRLTRSVLTIPILLASFLFLTACEGRASYKSIGLKGGTISSNGASLTIAPGQLSSALSIKIEKKTRSHEDVPSLPKGLEAMSALYSFETRGEARAPAQVTIPLSSRGDATGYLDLYLWKDSRWGWAGPASLSSDGRLGEGSVSSLPVALALVRATPQRPLVSGWLPAEGELSPAARETLSTINPLGYLLKADGTLAGSPASVPKGGKYQVLPTIQNKVDGAYDGALVGKVLASDLLRKRHVAAIASLARDNSYQGIDIDYRGMDPSLKEAFTQFIADLAQELHRENRSLTLSLPLPEKREGQGWESGAFDWSELGRAADYLKILPERDQGLYPSRMEEVLRYATSLIDRRKLQLVVSILSHEKGPTGIGQLTLAEALGIAGQVEIKRPAQVGPGNSLTLFAPNLLPDAGASGLFWNEDSKTVTFSYPAEQGAGMRTVWIENPFSLAFKLHLVERFGLGGVAIEDATADPDNELLWSVISDFRAKGSVGLAKPNNAQLGIRWESSDGSLQGVVGSWVNWMVPDLPGEHRVSASVGDGVSWVSSSLSFPVVSAPPLPTPTPPSIPQPTPPSIPQPTPVPTPAPPAPPQPQPSPTPVPTVPPVQPPPSLAGVGYGMQVAPENDLNRALGMLTGAGFNWAKVQLRWENLEQQKGNINWGFIDSVVNTTSARGVRLLVSVVTAPKWSRPADTDLSVPGPPANPQDFANFVGALAKRHKGKIHAYEIWNEQNLWYEWGGRGRKLNAAQYVELLRYSYEAIKAADPQAVVLSGAPTPTGINDGDTAYDDAQYLRMMYDAGMKNYSDAVAAHPSGYNNPPDDDPSHNSTNTTTFKGHWSFYYRRFEQFHDIMEEYGDGGKQIWFTEFGWASSRDPYPEYAYAKDNSEAKQAEYLVRAFEIARAKGYVGAMFVWNLNYAPIAEPNDRYAKRAFSIINPDWSPRPAYNALKAMPK